MTAKVASLDWNTSLNTFVQPGLVHPQTFVVMEVAWRTTTGAVLSALTSPGMTWARLGGSNVTSGLCVDLWIGYAITGDVSPGLPIATWAVGTATSVSTIALICSGPDPITTLPTTAVSGAVRLASNAAMALPAITPPANGLYVVAYAVVGSTTTISYVSDPVDTLGNLAVAGSATQQWARIMARQVCTEVPHSATITPPSAVTQQAGLAVAIALPDAAPLANVRLYKGRRTAALDQAGVS